MENKNLFVVILIGAISGVVCAFVFIMPMDLIFSGLVPYGGGYGWFFFALLWNPVISFVNGIIIGIVSWFVASKKKWGERVRFIEVVIGILVGLVAGGVICVPYYPDIDIPVSIHLFVGLAFNGGMIGYIVGLYLDRRKRQPAVISIMSEEE